MNSPNGRVARALAVCAVVGLAGCSTASPPPGPTAGTNTAPAVSIPTPSDGLPAAVAPLDWAIIVPGAPGFPSFGPVDEHLLIMSRASSDTTTAVTALQPERTSTFLTDPGEIVQPILASGNVVVFGLGVDLTSEYRLIVWSPTSNRHAIIRSGKYWSQYQIIGDRLFYTWPGSDGEQCLRSVSVAQVDSPRNDRQITCSQNGASLGWLTTDGTIVSFLTKGGDDPCFSVHTLEISGQDRVTSDIDGCVSRATATTGWAAWSDPPNTSTNSFFDTALVASSEDDHVDLGRAVAGSQVWCGRWLYWLASRFPGQLDHDQIRRWRPTTDQIQVVYESPDGNLDLAQAFSTSAPQCSSNGRISFSRVGWEPDSGVQLLTTGEFDWHPELPPTTP